MNSQLQSLQNSPSYNIFMENSSMSPFIYTLDKSIIPVSKNKYELSFSSSTNFGSSVSFDLLRVGILDHIVLKLRATGFEASTATPTTHCVGSYGGWINAVKSVSISSHNKRLLTLNADNIIHRISQMNSKKRMQVESSCQIYGVRPNKHNDDVKSSEYGRYGKDGLDTEIATNGVFGANSRSDSTGYVYIPFSIFDDLRSKASFDMEFIENLQLDIEFNTKDQLVEAGLGKIDNLKLDTVNSKVIVGYLDMMNSDLKKFENENYKIEGSNLNLVCRDYYKEAVPAKLNLKGDSSNPEAVGTADGKIGVFKIPIACRNLITSMMIRVQNTDDQTGLEGVEVLSIALHLDGREFLRYDAEELQLVSGLADGITVPNQTGYSYHTNGGASNPQTRASEENFYEIKFNQNQSNAFSGAISARSTASPYLLITVGATTVATAKAFECNVNCEIISLLSISQLDGKISKSQNL